MRIWSQEFRLSMIEWGSSDWRAVTPPRNLYVNVLYKSLEIGEPRPIMIDDASFHDSSSLSLSQTVKRVVKAIRLKSGPYGTSTFNDPSLGWSSVMSGATAATVLVASSTNSKPDVRFQINILCTISPPPLGCTFAEKRYILETGMLRSVSDHQMVELSPLELFETPMSHWPIFSLNSQWARSCSRSSSRR